MTLKKTFIAGQLMHTLLALACTALILVGCGSRLLQSATDLTPTPATNATIDPAIFTQLTPAAPSDGTEMANEGAGNENSAVQAAQCTDNLVFIKDVTIPDGTVVIAESTMDKRWEVENSGNCNWDANYRVRLIAGSELGAQKEQALYPARGGTRAVIRILFKAPREAGTYKSAWQAFNAQGEPFGDPFFIEIVVETP